MEVDSEEFFFVPFFYSINYPLRSALSTTGTELNASLDKKHSGAFFVVRDLR
jgi:hypothetical protein